MFSAKWWPFCLSFNVFTTTLGIMAVVIQTHHLQGDWWVPHDDVIKWKHFPHYWPYVQGIHRSPMNSSHKGQWHGALMFSLIHTWLNGWVNNHEAGDLTRHRIHYDVTVIWFPKFCWSQYDGVINWKHFPHNWPFVTGIHQSPVDSPHTGQWHRALLFSLICTSTNGWVNNRDAGDLRCHHAHYDITQ